MAALVLFLSFASTFFILSALTREVRASWVKTTIIYAILIALLTEGLSISQSLVLAPILSFWIGALAVNIALVIYLYKSNHLLGSQFYLGKFKASLGERQLSVYVFWAIASVLFITLATALIAPPDNWDSMTYHMSRVMHWMQNRSVEHYPTHILRQVSLPPGAGYLVMHLQFLAGGDYLANLVQWLAYFGCILVTTLIVQRLIGSDQQEYEWLGGLITASIPMAILQSTTTQTDLAVSYWLVCFLYFIIRTNTYKRSDLIWIGLTLGLAILTKPTAYVFGLPTFCLFLLRLIKDKLPSFKTKIANFTVFATLTLAIPLPYFLRNYQLFSNPVGTDYSTRNEIFGVVPFLSNLVRLIAINLPFQPWSALEWLHSNLLQIDINDPRITHSDITLYQENFLYIAPLKILPVASPIYSSRPLAFMLLAKRTYLRIKIREIKGISF
ncbi:MAG: hypothetical protein HC919_09410 [Oscillatoriales cyanobacterium SM2_2_1]|nr:hypothetical protein [Oscillatoriales cyanobacterium SM2_2_1]